MTEKIFNLFVFSNLDFISQIGVVCHEIGGTDEEKLSYLHEKVVTDFSAVDKFDLPDNITTKYKGLKRNGIDYMTYRDLCNKGQSLIIFENVFKKYNASENPLAIVTPVENGKIRTDGKETLKPPSNLFSGKLEIDKQDDWLIGYLDNSGLHLDHLINDDFFEAIRLLYNNNHYVSAMKLLMICVDTISYLEFGDIGGNFQKWINTYTKISDLNITADELWEFRNSILHMTNLDSRKVTQNKEKRLIFYVSHPDTHYQSLGDEGKYFKFIDLINCIGFGIGVWGETFNTERTKFETFVKRYDRILSDKRKTYIYNK
jgi:hypothetical protein